MIYPGSSTTKAFFPSTYHAQLLVFANPSYEAMCLLSGHNQLNSFCFKTNQIASPCCDCGFESETTDYFLFDCPLYMNHRSALILSAASLGLDWPTTLSNFTSSKSFLNSLSTFVLKTKKFRKERT